MNFGKHRGFGFIYFQSPEGQFNALKMQKNPPIIGKRAIVISENNHRHLQNHGVQTMEELIQEQDSKTLYYTNRKNQAY